MTTGAVKTRDDAMQVFTEFTKNEGLMAAGVALAVAAVVTAVSPNRGRLRPVGAPFRDTRQAITPETVEGTKADPAWRPGRCSSRSRSSFSSASAW